MSEDEKLEYVKRHVDVSSARIYFEDRILSAETKAEIDHLNTSSSRKWTYSHLLQGCRARVGPAYEKNVTPVLDNDDALRMWAYARMCAKA